MRTTLFPLLALVLTAVTAVGVELPVDPPPAAVPPPWELHNIGTVGVPGTATFTKGEFHVEGAGDDIFGTADKFAFLSQDAKGDAVISARITGQVNTHSWAKAGIMLRDGVGPTNAFVMLGVTPGNGLTFFWRVGEGAHCGISNLGDSSAYEFPIWLKLEKKGTSFTASRSADGREWTELAIQGIPAPFAALRAGMAVCSHDNSKLSAVVVDKVRIDP